MKPFRLNKPLNKIQPFLRGVNLQRGTSVEDMDKLKMKHARKTFKLTNFFKGVVFNIVLDIRAEKKKPKIGDILRVFN